MAEIGDLESGDSFKASSRWFTLDIRGRDITRIVTIIGVVFALGILGWVIKDILTSYTAASDAADLVRTMKERIPESKREHDMLREELRAQREELEVITYVLTLPDGQRPRLRPPARLLERLEVPVREVPTRSSP